MTSSSGAGEPAAGSSRWSTSELLHRLARAIDATRAHPARNRLDDVLMQLEDVEARIRAGETLGRDYRASLSFALVAIRELESAEDTHLSYLDELSELAHQLAV